MTMAAKMKRFKKGTAVLGLLAAGSLFSAQALADRLEDIKAAGVVKVATFDANPPFGSIDAKNARDRGLRRGLCQSTGKITRREA